MDSNTFWSLTGALPDEELEIEMARSKIHESIIKFVFGRKPIQRRYTAQNPKPDATIFRFVDVEIETIFYYIDKTEESASTVISNEMILELLNKYKRFFVDHDKEYQKLEIAIKKYKGL